MRKGEVLRWRPRREIKTVHGEMEIVSALVIVSSQERVLLNVEQATIDLSAKHSPIRARQRFGLTRIVDMEIEFCGSRRS